MNEAMSTIGPKQEEKGKELIGQGRETWGKNNCAETLIFINVCAINCNCLLRSDIRNLKLK